MDRIIAPNSVAQAQADVAPTTGTPQFASSGNPLLLIPATEFPPYQYNAIQEELIAIITRGALTPDRTNTGQVLSALLEMLAAAPQVFTGSGEIAVPAWATRALVEGWGGGGAGGAGLLGYAGAGGDGGGYGYSLLAVAPGTTVAYVVGEGGAGNASSGNPGGATSFGTTTLATGGGGGGASTSAGVGVGANSPGVGTGSLYQANGAPGQNGLLYGGLNVGGTGGGTPFGASNTTNNSSAAFTGNSPGGGGSGGVASSGGSGAAGLLKVRFLP